MKVGFRIKFQTIGINSVLLAITGVLFSLLGVMSMRFGKQSRRGQVLRCNSGQAMVEFVVVMGTLLATLAILMLFLGTFREYGTRVLNLVGSEYP